MTSHPQRRSVAVVIPYFNGSRWIARALDSVAVQSVPADEVIVVNDGSSAEERAALESLVSGRALRIIDQANGGQGSARNAGVAAAGTDYVCFLDQDDFYLPDHIEVLIDAIPGDDRRFGFLYGDAMEADADGNIVRDSMVREHNPTHPKRSVAEMIGGDMFVLPSAAVICRAAFLAVGGFDETFTGYEDDDLFLRLFRKGYSNHFIDRPVYVWCIHSESTSYSVRMSRSRFRYFEKLVSMFPDEPSRNRFYFRDRLAPRFGRAFIADAVRAANTRSPDRAELNRIVADYVAIVGRQPSVPQSYKLKLRMMAFVITRLPSGMVTAISTCGRRLVGRRRLFA